MNPFVRFLTSSIGRKYVMAVTGLSLTLFLLVHMAGNLTIYAGNEAFNEYADLLESNPPRRGWRGCSSFTSSSR